MNTLHRIFDCRVLLAVPVAWLAWAVPATGAEAGRGPGEGFNLNLPLERGSTLKPYLAALDIALARIAAFAPDVVVLAAGLDIAVDDPFKGFAIATPDFTAIGKVIAGLGKPLLIVQEGGYPSPSLGANLAALLSGLAA